MNDAPTIEERIKQRTDLTIAGGTSVSKEVGGLAFEDMGQVMEFSKLMAVAGQAVPKHLRGQTGACLAVSLQALNWRMDPFAVANKSYSVNDRIAYEAQLIQAVIEQRAPIKGRIKGHFIGEGQTRQCVLRVVSAEDDEPIEYTSPEIGKITTKNSPLWKADPDQQLWYYSARAMCRRHFPDVLLGVYEKEEMTYSEGMRDVTPKEPAPGSFADVARRGAEAVRKPQEGDETIPDAETPEDADLTPDAPAEGTDASDGASFTIDDLDLDEADPFSDIYTEGVKAFAAGKGHDDCPYFDDRESATHWFGGWTRAKLNADE